MLAYQYAIDLGAFAHNLLHRSTERLDKLTSVHGMYGSTLVYIYIYTSVIIAAIRQLKFGQ